MTTLNEPPNAEAPEDPAADEFTAEQASEAAPPPGNNKPRKLVLRVKKKTPLIGDAPNPGNKKD